MIQHTKKGISQRVHINVFTVRKPSANFILFDMRLLTLKKNHTTAINVGNPLTDMQALRFTKSFTLKPGLVVGGGPLVGFQPPG